MIFLNRQRIILVVQSQPLCLRPLDKMQDYGNNGNAFKGFAEIMNIQLPPFCKKAAQWGEIVKHKPGGRDNQNQLFPFTKQMDGMFYECPINIIFAMPRLKPLLVLLFDIKQTMNRIMRGISNDAIRRVSYDKIKPLLRLP